MLKLKKTLDDISQGEWERCGKNIQTRGGTFVGYAASAKDAAVMNAGPALLAILIERHPDDIELAEKISKLLKK